MKVQNHSTTIFIKSLRILSWILGISIAILSSLGVERAAAQKALPGATPKVGTMVAGGPSILSVGITLNRREAAPSIRVRGEVKGQEPIKFEEWLVSLDEIAKILKISFSTPPNGKLRLSSAFFVTDIDRSLIVNDPDLGRAIRIQDLRKLPGVQVDFDLAEYAIGITAQEAVSNSGTTLPPDSVDAPGLNLGGIEQRVTVFGVDNQRNLGGEFKALGTIAGSSWYTRLVQPQLRQFNTWVLAEAQVVNQSPNLDWILGSQPTFWRTPSGSVGDFWGGTIISRQGFTPGDSAADTFLPADRTQSDRLGRTVSGEANPGSLVRLVQGSSSRVIAEVLVDSRGVYRFENVATGTGSGLGNNLQVLVYPEGQVTANPRVQEVNFSTVVGQLPPGASAFVVTGGANRVVSGTAINVGGNQIALSDSLFGNFSGAKGGVSYRRGISDFLTVGGGVVYDRKVRGLGEIFFKPTDILQVAVSALSGDDITDVVSDVVFTPTPSIDLNVNTDRFSSRANLNWQVIPSFTANTSYDSRDGASVGGQLNFTSSPTSYTFARASINDNRRLRWNFNQRWDNFFITQTGNEQSTDSQVAFRFPAPENQEAGHELAVGYQTSSITNINSRLLGAEWRYRSPGNTPEGNPTFFTTLGYGQSEQGNRGFFGSLSANFIPGLQVTGRYQNIAVGSNQSEYSIELQTNLQFSGGGIRGTTGRLENFRTRGGISIQPFFDRNNNGRRDRGEAAYLEPSFLQINNQSIAPFRPELVGERINLPLPGGSYRLDFDAANYPKDWKPRIPPQRINIAPGSYTQIEVPLVLSYVLTGKISDFRGNPIPGVRVEAVAGGNRSTGNPFSVTNDNGIFYIEGLEQGNYQIKVNGQSAFPSQIFISPSSPATVESDFRVDPLDRTPQPQRKNDRSMSKVNVSTNF
jgi:hypothetical protein